MSGIFPIFGLKNSTEITPVLRAMLNMKNNFQSKTGYKLVVDLVDQSQPGVYIWANMQTGMITNDQILSTMSQMLYAASHSQHTSSSSDHDAPRRKEPDMTTTEPISDEREVRPIKPIGSRALDEPPAPMQPPPQQNSNMTPAASLTPASHMTSKPAVKAQPVNYAKGAWGGGKFDHVRKANNKAGHILGNFDGTRSDASSVADMITSYGSHGTKGLKGSIGDGGI